MPFLRSQGKRHRPAGDLYTEIYPCFYVYICIYFVYIYLGLTRPLGTGGGLTLPLV